MISKTLKELALLTETEFFGNPDHLISGVDELQTATSQDISFFSNVKYKELFKKSLAGAVAVSKATPLEEGKNYLISDNPSETFQKLVTLFCKRSDTSGFIGIHPTAVIHESAKIEENVQIGPYVVIDRDVTIATGTKIHPHVTVGPEVSIGQNCIIYPNVTIRECTSIGNRVIIQPGAVIGGCGFGFITNEYGKHQKVNHFGKVVLEDDVEIGSNTTIDRARFKETRIRKGSKVDNLVMIGHNAEIGEDNLIVAQAGVAGSSKTGKRVILAAQTGMVGHIEITNDVVLMARGAFSKSISKSGAYGGAPATPIHDYHEQVVHSKRLSQYAKRLQHLEKKANSQVETPC
jgi:UDP-3-O-[3-hydroxymyristoyl] glucosamine N-acyltransferase